jgi:hypothetical protein
MAPGYAPGAGFAHSPPAAGNDLPPTPVQAPPFPLDDRPPDFECPECTRCTVWGSVGYLLSFQRKPRVNFPLITTGSAADVRAGALGQPNTNVLFGEKPLNFDTFSGTRVELGVFLDHECEVSLDWVGMAFDRGAVRFAAASDPLGNPVLTRPVLNVVKGQSIAFFDALPNIAAGSTAVTATSELLGTEFNARFHCYGPCGMQGDWLVGFRYLRLSESLLIQDRVQPLVDNALTFLGTQVPAGSTITDFDRFRTINDFYGLQIGARFRYDTDWVFFAPYGKLAVGGTVQTIDIRGASNLTVPGAAPVQANNGGILALGSNIGKHDRTELGLVPEGGFTIGFKVTQRLTVSAGYSFLMWNHVARPGRQIDFQVNPAQVPTDVSFGTPGGPPRPGVITNSDLFWMHTLSAEVAFRY